MINTWNETCLHESLKHTWCGNDGAVEVPLNGVICDAVRSNGQIIEVQTGGFGKIKRKLALLLENNCVELVYPIAVNLVIRTMTKDGITFSDRKSPKHGTIYQLFHELTGVHDLLGHRNLTITAVFADVLEKRINDGTGSWRRKGVRIENRELIRIHETRSFHTISDYAALLPESIPEVFTVADLKANGAGKHAGRMAWVLRKTNCISHVGKSGNAFLYKRISMHEQEA